MTAINRERVAAIVLNDLKRSKDYFERVVEPALIRRRDVYRASKEYYEQKFPALSEKSDYRSFDFYSYIQWAKPTVLNSFFGPSQVISIVGQGVEDADSAALMDKFINWQLVQQCKGYLVFDSWIEDALIYELGVLKCWWRRETSMKEDKVVVSQSYLEQILANDAIEVLSVVPANALGDVEITVRHQTVIENRPEIDHVSPFDLRWSPDAKNLESASFVAQRKIVTVDELRRGAKSGLYDRFEVDAAIEDDEGVDWTRSELDINPELDDEPDEIDKARRRLELYECYVRFDSDGDGLLDDMIVTVVGDHVLRCEENTFGRIPFFVLSAHRDPDKVFCDISISEILGELQDLRTVMMRQLLVNVSLNNTPRQFVNDDIVNLDDLIKDSNYIRVTGEPSKAVMAVPTVPLAPITMNLFEYMKSLEEEWTGKTRYNQGTDASTLNKTATGIGLIMQAANQRINHLIKIFAETGVVQLYRHVMTLDQRFIDQEQVVRILNEPMKISPDDLTGEMDIIVNSDVGLGEKEQLINTITKYLQMGFPYALQLGIADSKDFSRAIIKLLEQCGWKDASTCIRTPQEIEAREQEQARQQAVLQSQMQDLAQQQLAARQNGNMEAVSAIQGQMQGLLDASRGQAPQSGMPQLAAGQQIQGGGNQNGQ